jgi:hypothetical protein
VTTGKLVVLAINAVLIHITSEVKNLYNHVLTLRAANAGESLNTKMGAIGKKSSSRLMVLKGRGFITFLIITLPDFRQPALLFHRCRQCLMCLVPVMSIRARASDVPEFVCLIPDPAAAGAVAGYPRKPESRQLIVQDNAARPGADKPLNHLL